MAEIRYLLIKDYIKQQISERVWQPGDMIHSENELTRLFNVSRMTVNRAIRELTAEGVLSRVQGCGTFVVDTGAKSSLLLVRDIREEIVERGHRHQVEVKLLVSEPADGRMAALLGVGVGADVFHVRLVHYENELSVQRKRPAIPS